MSERKWARQQYLSSADFRETIEEFRPLLDTFPYALIGGLAVSYYVNPPVTVDVDFLIEAEPAEMLDAVRSFKAKGWSVGKMFFTDNRKGFPKNGLSLRREFKAPYSIVDFLVTGKDEYLISVVERAEQVEVQRGVPLSVIKVEDLMILKSLAGREKDIEDVIVLTSELEGRFDEEYVNTKIRELE